MLHRSLYFSVFNSREKMIRVRVDIFGDAIVKKITIFGLLMFRKTKQVHTKYHLDSEPEAHL